MKLRIDAASSIGGRPSQDDCLVIGERPVESPPAHTVPPIFVDVDTSHPPLLAVLDGVGSCSYANLASSMTAAKIQSVFYSKEEGNEQLTAAERLDSACEQASEKLAMLNHSFGSIEAATTITAAAFSEQQLHLWATGDSPAYLYRKHTLRPLFETMNDGNRLLAFAGGPNTDFITSTYDLEAGDTVVLLTDGILRPKMLLLALRLGLSAQTIVRLSTTLKPYADNATLIKIDVVEV